MKNKIIFVITSLFLTVGIAGAEVIVKYDFGVYPNGTLVPSIQANHISAGNFGYVGDGAASFADHSGYGLAYQIYGGWPGSTYSDYFCFTVTIAAGWSLNLDSRCVWFDAATTSMNGPNLGKVTYLGNPETILRDNIEIGGSGWYTYKTNSTPTPTGLTGTIEFRIYGKDATAYGQFSIDNVILNGTLIELPPAEPTENIDPQDSNNQYAYGENVGWINFEPDANDAGAIVSREKVEGYVWAENIGWINLSPENYGGVFNNGYGNLSGYAWSENVGWINFDPNYGGIHYGVKIDANGNFSGYGWGENIGWINFNNADLFSKGVKVCVVNYTDLKTLAEQWLTSGAGLSADLKPDGTVDFEDFSIFAKYWFDYCPGNWPL
ncbi:MAG: hypothetical protein ACYC3B_02190 [Sedimentisphaerales bacterium]